MLSGIRQEFFPNLCLDALDCISIHRKIMYNFGVLSKFCDEVTDLRSVGHGGFNEDTQLGPPVVVVPGKGGFPKIFVVLGWSPWTSYPIDEYESPLPAVSLIASSNEQGRLQNEHVVRIFPYMCRRGMRE